MTDIPQHQEELSLAQYKFKFNNMKFKSMKPRVKGILNFSIGPLIDKINRLHEEVLEEPFL